MFFLQVYLQQKLNLLNNISDSSQINTASRGQIHMLRLAHNGRHVLYTHKKIKDLFFGF